MEFDSSDILKLKKLLSERKNSSSSDDELPVTKTSTMGPGHINRSKIKIKGNECKEDKKPVESDPYCIWELYEVPEVPLTDDVLSDPRIQPEYDIKYKQFVGTEDVFLQMGNKTPTTASCEGMVINICLTGEKKGDIDCDVSQTHLDIRSPSYRLNLALPHQIDPDLCSAEWNDASGHLILNLTMTREYDYINF